MTETAPEIVLAVGQRWEVMPGQGRQLVHRGHDGRWDWDALATGHCGRCTERAFRAWIRRTGAVLVKEGE